MIIRSGKGTNNATTLYWGQSVSGSEPDSRNNFAWNNSSDIATLKSGTGTTLHTCKYTRTKSSFKTC